MALALRTAVRGIRTPNNVLCRRWNTSDVFNNSKNAFNFPNKYSGSRLVTHKGSQQLKEPILEPIKVPYHQRVGEYFSDPNNCVFPKHLKPWQKFVCGGIGLTAGIVGLVAGLGVTMAGLHITVEGLFKLKHSYNDWKKTPQTIQIEDDDVVVVDDSMLDNLLDMLGNGMAIIVSLPIIVYDTIEAVTPEIVFDSTMLGIATVATPALGIGSVTLLSIHLGESIKFFKEIRKMDNCCNIIRFGAKGAGVTAIVGVIIGFLGTASYTSANLTHTIVTQINHKWNNDEDVDGNPYRPVGDKYDQVYDTNGPILD